MVARAPHSTRVARQFADELNLGGTDRIGGKTQNILGMNFNLCDRFQKAANENQGTRCQLQTRQELAGQICPAVPSKPRMVLEGRNIVPTRTWEHKTKPSSVPRRDLREF